MPRKTARRFRSATGRVDVLADMSDQTGGRAAAASTHPQIDFAQAWLQAEARKLRWPLAHAASATALHALCIVAQAWLLADILAAALFHHAALATLWREWVVLLLIVPLRTAFDLYARRRTFASAVDLTTHLRQRVLARAEALGPVGLRALDSGAMITRVVDGIDALLPYFARYLPQAAAAVVVPLMLAAAVLSADWISGLVLVFTAPLIPILMALVGGSAARASQARMVQLTRLGSAFMDALGGLVTLRQLGAAGAAADRLDREGEDYRKLTMQVLRVAFLSALVLEFFAMASIAIVAVLIGFRLLWHELAFRQGLFVLLLAPEFYLPLRALGSLRHARMDALAAARELAEMESGAASRSPMDGGKVPPIAAPRIRFTSLRFSHHGRGGLLDDVSFDLQPGQVTALVGPSGAGKSTLVDLLLGFAQPEQGRISVDGTDLAELDIARWRDRIAWAPQRGHVFDGSVRENLLLAQPDADREALARAAAASGLDDIVARLPRGWDTPLGEYGMGLSGGELQRLVLARAFVRERASILLLDEPTAHLDAESAARIETEIRLRAATRTVLIIAHRPESMRDADRVVVLDGGRVVEQGAPGALEHQRGTYASLLKMGAA